jgi:predicted ATP-binding protein involved in virulence
MQIHRLKLENFRCFGRYEIELAPRFTLLIGDNGTGKTALLDALAVAASSLFLGMSEQGVVAREIDAEDVRSLDLWVGQTLTREERGPTVVTAKGWILESLMSWTRSLASKKGKATQQGSGSIKHMAEQMVKHVQAGDTITLPIIAYYGSHRSFRFLSGQSRPVGNRTSRLAGYRRCMDPASRSKRLFRWFKTNELAAMQKGQKRYVLEAVRAGIVAMIPGATRAYWDLDWDELTIKLTIGEDDRRLPFHLLSDGYRSMVGMAADIAYRMAMLNPHLLERAIEETPGFVLIDEIDLHLHPNWQRQVVGHLLQAFPQVQFVATTHSPFIIQSLHGLDGVLLWDLSTSRPLAVETKSIEDIAEEKQGVEIPQQSHRFLEMMRVAEEYYGLLRRADDADARRREELKDELDRLSLPYSDEPAYQAFLNQQRIAAGLNGSPES